MVLPSLTSLLRRTFGHLVTYIGLMLGTLMILTPAKAQSLNERGGATRCKVQLLPADEPCEARPSRELGPVLSQFGWRCPKESTVCEGNFPVAVGSGGAVIDGFYNLRPDHAAKGISVSWNCPVPRLDVIVSLSVVGGYSRQRIFRCDARNAGDAFDLPEFKDYKSEILFAQIRLVTDQPCVRPVYIVATVTVPDSHFKRSAQYCDSPADACLIISSTYASADGWIAKVQAVEKKGKNRIESLPLSVMLPARCEFVPVFVDFYENESKAQNKKPHTIMAELWF
jgi:hypothetical protein